MDLEVEEPGRLVEAMRADSPRVTATILFGAEHASDPTLVRAVARVLADAPQGQSMALGLIAFVAPWMTSTELRELLGAEWAFDVEEMSEAVTNGGEQLFASLFGDPTLSRHRGLELVRAVLFGRQGVYKLHLSAVLHWCLVEEYGGHVNLARVRSADGLRRRLLLALIPFEADDVFDLPCWIDDLDGAVHDGRWRSTVARSVGDLRLWGARRGDCLGDGAYFENAGDGTEAFVGFLARGTDGAWETIPSVVVRARLYTQGPSVIECHHRARSLDAGEVGTFADHLERAHQRSTVSAAEQRELEQARLAKEAEAAAHATESAVQHLAELLSPPPESRSAEAVVRDLIVEGSLPWLPHRARVLLGQWELRVPSARDELRDCVSSGAGR